MAGRVPVSVRQVQPKPIGRRGHNVVAMSGNDDTTLGTSLGGEVPGDRSLTDTGLASDDDDVPTSGLRRPELLAEQHALRRSAHKGWSRAPRLRCIPD